MAPSLLSLLCWQLGFVSAFLEGGFDPNAINGFGSGSFNPNAGYSTIAPPSINGGSGTTSGSGFDPNKGLATTLAPPTGFTGWSGSGNFNPNSGNLLATTSSPDGGSLTGNWNWGSNGGTNRKLTTVAPFGNHWGFGTGSHGFNPNAGFSTGPTPKPATAATLAPVISAFPTIHPTTVRPTQLMTSLITTFPTIHPSTVNRNLIFGGQTVKTTPHSIVGQRVHKSKVVIHKRKTNQQLIKQRNFRSVDLLGRILGK